MDMNNNLENQIPNELEINVVSTEQEETSEVESNDMMELEELVEESINVDDINSSNGVLPNELGKVTNVGSDSVLIEITSSLAKEMNLMEKHVIFNVDEFSSIVGTVASVNNEMATIKLQGEVRNGRFVPGVLSKPAIGSVCFVATEDEIDTIVIGDRQTTDVVKKVLIGNMPLYNNTPAYVSVNSLFNSHISIFGNSGSGKSCGVARLFQNVFYNQNEVPKNACVIIFDAYGEYENALAIPNNRVFYKKYTTDVTNKENLIKIPLWLLNIDDYALLLDVDDVTQIPIIEKALRLVTVFSGDERENRVYKNDIIAKAILEVLYSGASASQIHDQVFAILTSYNTPDLNLETPIMQPGYTRSLRQCLMIDKEGKIAEMQLVSEFIKKYINDDLRLELPNGKIPYTLEHLKEAFDFALISEGIFKSDKIYDKANVLKVRLETLIKSEYAEYFKYDKYVDKVNYVKELITASNGARAQIVNVNISYLDDRLAKTICKIYSKLLFDFAVGLPNRGVFPVHIILEEAHRYVQEDSDTKILGYNIFDRIAKEGRKYGVILGLISQRPSELSSTALSQCANFLIFKMQHPHDVTFIKQMVPHITDDIVERMKSLQPGTCIAFGSAFKLPTIIKMEMPNPEPLSQNVDLSRVWY